MRLNIIKVVRVLNSITKIDFNGHDGMFYTLFLKLFTYYIFLHTDYCLNNRLIDYFLLHLVLHCVCCNHFIFSSLSNISILLHEYHVWDVHEVWVSSFTFSFWFYFPAWGKYNRNEKNKKIWKKKTEKIIRAALN